MQLKEFWRRKEADFFVYVSSIGRLKGICYELKDLCAIFCVPNFCVYKKALLSSQAAKLSCISK